MADVATSPSSSSNWSFVRFCFQRRDQATSTSRLIKLSPTFAHSSCAIGQRQTNAQGQQVLAIELLPNADGLEGSLIMPFGLAVTQPVMLAIDEGPPVEDSFSTCVLTGCIVRVETPSEILEAMCTGSSVTISARYQ